MLPEFMVTILNDHRPDSSEQTLQQADEEARGKDQTMNSFIWRAPFDLKRLSLSTQQQRFLIYEKESFYYCGRGV